MHNRVSHNQLAGWSMNDDLTSKAYGSDITKIDDYFDCLIECADLPNS